MKIRVNVVSCNAPTVRVTVGNEGGQSVYNLDPKDTKNNSVEVEGTHIKIEAGPDARAMTSDEIEHEKALAVDAAKKAAEAKANAVKK